MGQYKDWDACILDQTGKGHSEESAKKICGAIKAKTEGNSKAFEEFKLNDDEKKCVEEYSASIGDGQGQGLPKKGEGGRDTCICPSCGETVTHDRGTPCTEQSCPKCGSSLAPGKFTETIQAEIFASGQWNKDKYTEADLDQLASNFETLKDVVKPPAKIGHSEKQDMLKKEGLPAAGWVEKVEKVGNKLVATFRDVPKVIKDLIEKKAYKRVSAEIYPKYKDPRDGKMYKNVLRAVAFLGGDIPAVETLSDIASLYAKGTDDSGQEFKTYGFDLAQDAIHKSDNTNNNPKGGVYCMKSCFRLMVDGTGKKDELVKKLSEAFGEGVQVAVEEENMDEEERKKKEEEMKRKADDEIKEKKIEELTQKFNEVAKASGDKDVTIAKLNEKLATLEKMSTEATANFTKAASELEEIKKNARLSAIKMFVKEQVDGGRILPKDEPMVVALMEQLDEKQVVKFSQDGNEVSESMIDVLKKFIQAVPKAVEFNELSAGDDTASKFSQQNSDGTINVGGVSYEVKNQELVEKANKYAQEHKVAFEEAIIEVSR